MQQLKEGHSRHLDTGQQPGEKGHQTRASAHLGIGTSISFHCDSQQKLAEAKHELSNLSSKLRQQLRHGGEQDEAAR